MTALFGRNTSQTMGDRPQQIASALSGGALRACAEKIDLCSQASGDTIAIGQLPAGAVVHYGLMAASTTLGSAKVAIGTADAAAKYRASATFTEPNAPQLFGVVKDVLGEQIAVAEDLIMTIDTAALPAEGEMTVMLVYSTSQ